MVIVEGRVRGKQRPRYANGHMYTPKETKDYERQIKKAYIEQSGFNSPFKGAVKVRIEIYLKVPKSYSKRQIKAIEEGSDYPTKKPDSDNVAKVVLDAINGTAYLDDKQIIELKIIKRWTITGSERIEFEVKEL